MNCIPPRSLIFAMASLASLAISSSAFGQYVWLDERGVKQYSDMPPPSSIPSTHILKQPRGGATSFATTDASSEAKTPPRSEMTTAEKNAEYRKRLAEQVDKEKKAADEARAAADKGKNCQRARDYQQALESGERIAQRDKNGERTFLTDEQRNQELRENKRVLEECR